ncbi:MAG: hypothetical protein HY786_09110 [Deltaproteobacteria bacterium]|nr:hypothetical protein [Deltaproteobacteria bacterium]
MNAGNPNIYEIREDSDRNKSYPEIVLGGHYTFKNGINIIGEYIYNGQGYDGSEWDELTGFIKYSYDNYKGGYLADLMRLNLLQANRIMTFRQMRRNYIFTRISDPALFSRTDAALVVLINADDGSYLTNPSLDYKIDENSSIGFNMLFFNGRKDMEFGMTHWGSEGSLVYKYLF